jgi:hypothetical protein
VLSKNAREHRVFAHTGWRQVDGTWVYLHGGGAIGPTGADPFFAVDLSELRHYELPAPPDGRALIAALRASLGILDVAADRITIPLLAATYRAALDAADFSIHLAGGTGAGKTELAALAQQHFGATMNARRLPASWSSTPNALENQAFIVKDALLTIDDFCPSGTPYDISRAHRDADRVFRGQGNHSGRGRLRADITARAPRPPRGLILSTGEEIPRGASLRSRLVVLELRPDDVSFERLTVCQADAVNGLFSQAIAGFVRWVASDRSGTLKTLHERALTYRTEATRDRGHRRVPANLAELFAGFSLLLDFALASGALETDQREAYLKRAAVALASLADIQLVQLRHADPVDRALDLLRAAVTSGRAHLGRDGDTTGAVAPTARRIGWESTEGVFLIPAEAYSVVQELAAGTGEALGVGEATLWRRFSDRHLLASTEQDQRGSLKVRRTFDGGRRHGFIHLLSSTFYGDSNGGVRV